MTMEQALSKRLIDNGIWEQDAPALVEKIKADEVLKEMQGRWQEPTEAYPSVMQNVIWISAKRVVLEWIDATKPQAWYRAMFV